MKLARELVFFAGEGWGEGFISDLNDALCVYTILRVGTISGFLDVNNMIPLLHETMDI